MAAGDGTEELEKRMFEALVLGTKASNSLPSGHEELSYFESLPEFKERIGAFRERIVKLILELAANVDSSDQLFNLDALRSAEISDVASFEPVANVIELLLENVDDYLQEAVKGANGGDTAGAGDARRGDGDSNKQLTVTKGELVRGVRAGLHGVITHANIERPQKNFGSGQFGVDNSRNPFRPRLTHKPNAVVPLPEGGPRLLDESEQQQRQSSDGELHGHTYSTSGVEQVAAVPRYEHPYEAEVRAALQSPPAWLLEAPSQVVPVEPLDKVPCTWVDTAEGLKAMCDHLETQHEIAVDLENHSYRSFQGFVCLMQVSTRSNDYLVDTLALREHMHTLNGVFTNPAIVKVFHGADSDVVWLQRDFGLYLVSLFDTGRAARKLEYPSAGLAHALLRHCKIRVNKAYQLADWRIRPLGDEMFKYAREDTHYLLYVFDCMRRELVKSGGKDAVFEVLKASAFVALNVYEKEAFSPTAYEGLLRRKKVELGPVEEQVFASVYGWRDIVARREDESTNYVLPDRMLLRIAKELPAGPADLEQCCNPLPPVVQTRVTEVLALIRSAQDAAATPKKSIDSSGQSTGASGAAGRPDKPAQSSAVPGEVQIGLNASKSSFVPIQPTPDGKPKASVSFADITKGGAGPPKDRRGSLIRDEANARATPSPVLTTEELYVTAGWQDIADPQWKASVQAAAASAANAASSGGRTGPNTSASGQGARTAAETRAKIGREQLQSNAPFGALAPKISFAKVAAGGASQPPPQQQQQQAGRGSGTTSAPAGGAGVSASSVSATDGAGGTNDTGVDIDTPADADALESDDIPRSMAEIYRISNKNRKRNKDKKKLKDDQPMAATAGGGGAPGQQAGKKNARSPDTGSAAPDNRNNKRHKDHDDAEPKDPHTDDAIEFMRGIGWVEGDSKPVATLTVQGAPEQPAHLAGATAESVNTAGASGTSPPGPTPSSGAGKASHGSKGRGGGGGRRGVPGSPKRKSSSSAAGAKAQQQPQQQQGGQQRQLFGYAQAAASGGFSYSQVAASSAGVKYSGSSSNANKPRR
ncbi:Exosome component 10 (Autoantigen PM/Scl 2) (P100 polymyositis-scleroderma overlap syndrome-associated autoantigen) (Polymyositis/scleroderma autoantigen 100 kDa) (PM/Scl-100) (Polymyositis/scleroderma autoantigen 2) [Durusdinium trenchii]|uniref:HRDC domain-containing protein n=1 Tax=Durusdinium trenchii TaxID=1381693 RepID=A0ABP0KZY0_9DINO